MAAIMALILLPTIAAIGCLLLSSAGASFGTIMGGLVFTALALGVFVSLFKLVQRWENESA